MVKRNVNDLDQDLCEKRAVMESKLFFLRIAVDQMEASS